MSGGDRDATTYLGSFISSVTGAEKVDLRKVSKSFEDFKWILRLEKPMDIVLAVINSVKAVYGCQNVTFYPLDYHIVTLLTNKQYLKPNQVIHTVEFGDEETGQSGPIAAICQEADEPIREVLFKTFKFQNLADRIAIADKGTKFALALCKCQKTLGTSFIVQGEYPKKSDKNKKGKGQTHISNGDILMLQLVFTYLSIKLEKIIYNNNFKVIKSDVDNTISMVRDVLSQKSLKSLMRSYIRVIPKFFKFG